MVRPPGCQPRPIPFGTLRRSGPPPLFCGAGEAPIFRIPLPREPEPIQPREPPCVESAHPLMRLSPRPSTIALRLLPFLIGLVGAAPIQAQWIENPVAPRFGVRLGSLPSVSWWGERFGPGGAVPLGTDLDSPQAGTGLLPHLAPVESLVRSLSGLPDFDLRLGAVRAIRSTTVVTVPISLDLGLTSFLTVGATVPFLRRRTEADVRFTPSGATTGFNPALADPEGVDAFLLSFGGTLAEGRALVDALCGSDPASDGCLDGQAALTDGEALLEGLEILYRGSPVAPLTESLSGGRILVRFATIAQALGALGAQSPVDLPPLADSPLDAEGFALLTSARQYGIALDTLGTQQRSWEPGDTDLHATLRLLERVDRDTTGAFTGRTFLAAGVIARIPTGEPAPASDPFDPGTGGGSLDMTLRLLGDLARPRWGVGVDARYTRRGTAELERRVAAPEGVLAGLSLLRPVERSGGHMLSVQAAPRLAVTQDFGIGVAYRFTSLSGDRYRILPFPGAPPISLPLDPTPPDPAVLAQRSQGTLHHLGFQVAYTSVNASRDGRATGRAFDVFVRYDRAIAAGGGIRSPRTNTFQGGVTLHLGGF